jgi:hypothetical protein
MFSNHPLAGRETTPPCRAPLQRRGIKSSPPLEGQGWSAYLANVAQFAANTRNFTIAALLLPKEVCFNVVGEFAVAVSVIFVHV